MSHRATPRFWSAYERLPIDVQRQADAAYETIKRNPTHPALNLKKTGRFWSARIGIHYRALAIEAEEGFVWFWIGTHAEYDRLLR